VLRLPSGNFLMAAVIGLGVKWGVYAGANAHKASTPDIAIPASL
jgi:hypothetical protein